MRGRKGSTTQWYCPSGCFPKPHETRKPCRDCCGWTADRTKHFQGDLVAATKN